MQSLFPPLPGYFPFYYSEFFYEAQEQNSMREIEEKNMNSENEHNSSLDFRGKLQQFFDALAFLRMEYWKDLKNRFLKLKMRKWM